jgi:hypothetical protein
MSRAPHLDRSASFFAKAVVHGGEEEEKEAERKVRHRRRPPPQQQAKRRKNCEHGCPTTTTTNQEDCRPGQTKLISAANLQFLNYLGFHVNKSWVEKDHL